MVVRAQHPARVARQAGDRLRQHGLVRVQVGQHARADVLPHVTEHGLHRIAGDQLQLVAAHRVLPLRVGLQVQGAVGDPAGDALAQRVLRIEAHGEREFLQRGDHARLVRLHGFFD
ncbi:hypothetical protein D3C72_1591350 [compost metagenome]